MDRSWCKSEGGNIWLDKNKTSVYKFYQYWLNITDEDAISYIKVFTFLSKDKVEDLIQEHNKDKARRILQNKIAGGCNYNGSRRARFK